MSGAASLRAFVRKELLEIARTWRLWVLPGILVFIGLLAPISAAIAPALVRSMASDQPGVVIELPDPVALDSYRQFTSSLIQIALLALIVSTAGIVSGEARAGTLALVLTKPVSRAGFLLAKALAQAVLVLGALALGTLVCWLGTLAVFGWTSPVELLAAAGLWLVLALLVVALMTLLSVVVPAVAGAAGIGIASYLALTILATWGPARRWTPAGLVDAVPGVLQTGGADAWRVPVLAGALLAAGLLALAIWHFGRQELAARGREG